VRSVFALGLLGLMRASKNLLTGNLNISINIIKHLSQSNRKKQFQGLVHDFFDNLDSV
jgi:hypothetical protein